LPVDLHDVASRYGREFFHGQPFLLLEEIRNALLLQASNFFFS
jgi:hypothetical protein